MKIRIMKTKKGRFYLQTKEFGIWWDEGETLYETEAEALRAMIAAKSRYTEEVVREVSL